MSSLAPWRRQYALSALIWADLVTRRTDSCQTWLWQMTICMIIASSKLPVSVLLIEYETLALGGLGHTWAG